MKLYKILFLPLLLIVSFIFIQKANCTIIQNSGNTKISFATETANSWTPTFQLCWNELIKLVGTPKIEYVDKNPDLANELNKQKFNKNDINEDSYYISVTKMTLKHKKEIEKAIKDKFNETSDILKEFEFKDISDNKTNAWFIYSMLIKHFKFNAKYNILNSDNFNGDKTTKYKYFGYLPESKNSEIKSKLDEQAEIIYYADDNDYALKLFDKDRKEEMILYLTNSDNSFDEIYNELLVKEQNKSKYTAERLKNEKNVSGAVNIKYINYYKIPFLHINEKLNFDKELAGKPIKDKTYNLTGYTWNILKTLQTIKFDLDNEGAYLKSEAAIAVMKATAVHNPIQTITLKNYFYFNRPFVIFLKEKGKDKPYFAAKVKDEKYLVKQ